jgi:hypothetical protein
MGKFQSWRAAATSEGSAKALASSIDPNLLCSRSHSSNLAGRDLVKPSLATGVFPYIRVFDAGKAPALLRSASIVPCVWPFPVFGFAFPDHLVVLNDKVERVREGSPPAGKCNVRSINGLLRVSPQHYDCFIVCSGQGASEHLYM